MGKLLLLRWQIFSIYGVALVSIWIAARNSVSQSSASSPLLRLGVDFAPLWGILLLGMYFACSIVYGVISLRDHEEAATALEQEVEEAKKELRKRGILDAGKTK